MGAVLVGAARLGALGAACSILLSCGPSAVELQEAPTELQSVAAIYDAPTGTVPASAMDQIVDLQQKLDTINSTRLGGLMTDALVGLRRRLEDAGVPTDPSTMRKKHRAVIVGSVTLDRTCRGWDDASTTPDPANGALEVVAQVEASALQRLIWGTATACKGRVDLPNDLTAHPFVDGSIAIYLEGPLPDNANDAQFIMAWNGTLGLQAAEPQRSGSFDFRVINQQIEVRIVSTDGDIIGAVGAGEISFRGSNGTFGCSLVTFECGQL